MPVPPFHPTQIYVDERVRDLPLTRKILARFPAAKIGHVADVRALKAPGETKKTLLLARKKADPLKEFRALSSSCRIPYFSLDLVSNCHLACTYCILQSYLQNNPILTIFTNWEEIFNKLENQMLELPPRSVIGTGRIADSLALEPITGHAQELIQFFRVQNGHFLELKTKTDLVGPLLDLDHGGRTILSWSLAPQSVIDREEFKTASLVERLDALEAAAVRGYWIGLHFDPVILHEGWQENYRRLVADVFQRISQENVYWASIGSLRFPERQRRLMRKNYPKNSEIYHGLLSTDRRFLHYSEELREEIYRVVAGGLKEHLAEEKIYTCMEEFQG